MRSTIISTTSDHIASGGTITGDLTISGDLTVEGSGGAVYDEIIEGSLHIKTASAGTISDLSYADDLVIENSVAVGLSLRCPDAYAGAIAWQSDSNDTVARIYGFYNSNAEILAFETDDTERMRITSTGIIFPTAFHIGNATSDTADSAYLTIGAASAGANTRSSYINFYGNEYDSDAQKGRLTLIAGLGDNSGNKGDIIFEVDGGEKMRLDSTGNVGIGTTTPDEQLEISSEGTGNSGVVMIKGGEGSGALIHMWADEGDDNADKWYLNANEGGYFSITTYATGSWVNHLELDTNSRISLSNNDSGSTGGADSTTGNTLFGYLAGEDIASGGHNNTLIGHGSGKNITKGNHNVSIGTGAMDAMVGHADNSGGLRNIAIGVDALGALDVGTHASASCQHNIGIGYDALKGAQFSGATVMKGCIALGNYALDATGANAQTGTIAIGHQSLTQLSSSTGCTAVGYQSGYSNTGSGMNNNTLFGYETGWYTTGANNTYVGYNAGKGAAGAESNNVGVGSNALLAITTGGTNIAIGRKALTAATACNENTVIGFQSAQAFSNVETGNISIGANAMNAFNEGGDGGDINYNVALGLEAFLGASLAGGTNEVIGNIAIGAYALDATSSNAQTGTIAIGYNALTTLTSGAGNIAVGYQALQQQTDGANNVAIGYTALNTANTGESNNISIGYQSMLSVDHADADNNVVIGHQAGIGGGAAMSGCVAIGANAMDSTAANAQTGTIAIGQSALTALTSGAGNTAVGYQSGLAITTGANNTALGYTALDELVDGSGNTAIGSYAMGDTVGGTTSDGSSNNTAVGYNAAGGTWADQDCSNIVAIGHNALSGALAGDTADGSVAVGKAALAALTTGAGNTAVGYVALTANLVGSANTALGHSALKSFVSDTSGHGNNTALGYFAGAWVDDGTENTFVGASSGQGITGTRLTGNLNTALGFESGLLLQGAAVNNTLIGARAGDGVTTGDQNTGIGAAVAFDVDAGNQTCVGYQATTSAANAVKIGNGSVSAANIQVDWTIDSDSRIKKDIKDSDVGLSFINALKPRKYKRRHPSEWDSEILEKRYKQGGGNYDDDKDEVIKDEFDDSKTWDGLIAQEVKEVIDKSGTTFSGWSEDGDGKQGIQYSSLVVPLIKAVQELTAKVEALENK